jgi:gliding motility-associated-like protein
MNLTTYKYLAFFVASTLGTNVYAQKQNNQWRFGTGGGIDFNSAVPTFVPGASIATDEGSASVADRESGALLFYTDGVTVWNANNQVMPNGSGLLGGLPNLLSSTTAAVIVPKPGSSTLYYLVTIDEQGSNNGVRYSVVDMGLNGGLGDVVAGQKNIPLLQSNSEKLEVVPSSDGTGYWLLTHDFDAFYAFKIEANGIQPTPVISQIGGTQGVGAGHMKVNKQFTKIAIGLLTLGASSTTQIELFDFNNATGEVSNGTALNYPTVVYIYGIEFSPNGKVLYVSDLENLVQYDLTQPTPLAIQNSAYVVSTNFSRTLQVGIDDKIYINEQSIGAIQCPNELGAACSYQPSVLANQTGGGGYGLPKWVYYPNDPASQSSLSIAFADSCLWNATTFSLPASAGISNVLWNFGDPASGSSNTASGLTANHTFAQVGTYSIQAIVTGNCGVDTLYLNALSIVDCGNPCTVNVPNVFSPNLDGVNETFSPNGSCTFEQYDFQILNRWGKRVFQTEDPSEKWTGKYNGSPCPDGVYFYVLKYKFPFGTANGLSGSVTLLQ